MAFLNGLSAHETQFFLAIGLKNNEQAQKLLQEYPTMTIDHCDPSSTIPYALLACRNSDNAAMLELLLHHGFTLTPYLKKQEFIYALTNNKPALIKFFLKQSVLTYLTPDEQVISFINLLKQLEHYTPEEQQKYLELFVSSELTIITHSQARVLLFTLLAEYLTLINLSNYSKHLTHDNMHDSTYNSSSDSSLQSSPILRSLSLLEKHGLDLHLKQPDYRSLIQALARKGCTELVRYLVLKTNLPDLHTIQEALASSREQTQDEQASEFIHNTMVNLIPLEYPEPERTIKHALADFLLEHWIKHKNKSVVKLLREFVTIQRLFNSRTTPEIAHKIAQYAIADFQDNTLALLPNYTNVQEFIAQKNVNKLLAKPFV